MADRDITQELETLQRRVYELEKKLSETRTPVSRKRRLRGVTWVLVVMALIVSATAYAQLKPMVANTPARASDINDNFNQLKDWLVQKVGTEGSADVVVTGSTTLGGATTINSGVSVNGRIRLNQSSDVYDVWIQGNTSSDDGGDGRNLALLGYSETSGDLLVINWGGEYGAGTRIDGALDIGLERKVCDNIASGANCDCPSGKRLLGGGALCYGNNDHVNTSWAADADTWQAWCENSSGTNQNVRVTILCARM
jgi:hypothetical protein